MASRKAPSRNKANPTLADDAAEVGEADELDQVSGEELSEQAVAEAAQADTAGQRKPESDAPTKAEAHQPRFHFFLIDAGWKSASARVVRENFHMIREFQNDDPLYVLSQEQSIELIRNNPDLIGKDPLLLVHDLHAKGGRGESGYHGFRLCLGLIKDSQKALEAMQEFLRFVHSHRRSADIEKDIRKKLHHAGLEGALEVIREGASELME